MNSPGNRIHKYPRTHHLQGSRLQPGDEDLGSEPFTTLEGRHVVIEEKLDGANAAVSFDEEGKLLLQSRGHFLTGGGREKHFTLFKQWATAHTGALREILGSRYVLYGEWLFAKHTIFYDALPHYFLEFDVLDTNRNAFLGTQERRALLGASPVVPVPVLFSGTLPDPGAVPAYLGPSHYILPGHLERLREACARLGLDADRVLRETDPLTTMEGLYVKIEEEGIVQARYKFIRPSFLTTVLASESHWLNRPIVPNRLARGVDLFS